MRHEVKIACETALSWFSWCGLSESFSRTNQETTVGISKRSLSRPTAAALPFLGGSPQAYTMPFYQSIADQKNGGPLDNLPLTCPTLEQTLVGAEGPSTCYNGMSSTSLDEKNIFMGSSSARLLTTTRFCRESLGTGAQSALTPRSVINLASSNSSGGTQYWIIRQLPDVFTPTRKLTFSSTAIFSKLTTRPRRCWYLHE